MKKFVSILLVATMIFSVCVFSASGAMAQDTDAFQNGLLKIVLDGENVVPVGDGGVPVLPITYNSSTFLPLRAMAYLLGMTVAWVGESSTVYLKSGADNPKIPVKGEVSKALTAITGVMETPGISIVLDGVTVQPVGDDALPVSPLLYLDSVYLPLRAMAYLLGLDVAWDAATNTITLTTIDLTGARGPSGGSGPAGQAGPPGPAGPEGQAGILVGSYVEAVGEAQVVATNSFVVFDFGEDYLDIVGSAITADDGGGVFTIHQAGLYSVEWSVNVSSVYGGLLCLLENGGLSSPMAFPDGDLNVSSGALIWVREAELPYTISLFNYGAPISLNDASGSENTAASIRIFRFADEPA